MDIWKSGLEGTEGGLRAVATSPGTFFQSAMVFQFSLVQSSDRLGRWGGRWGGGGDGGNADDSAEILF